MVAVIDYQHLTRADVCQYVAFLLYLSFLVTSVQNHGSVKIYSVFGIFIKCLQTLEFWRVRYSFKRVIKIRLV